MGTTPHALFDQELQACRKCQGLLSIVPVDPIVSDACVQPRPIAPGINKKPVLLIGQAPGIEEYRTSRAFQGQAGQGIRSVFRSIGIRDFDKAVYSSAVVKCFPGRKLRKIGQPQSGSEDRVPSPQMVANCRSFLEREIALVDPRVIVTLGSFPLKAYLGLSGHRDAKPTLEQYVGRTHNWNNRTVVFFPHTSGGSRWLNKQENKRLFATAQYLLRQVLIDCGVISA